MNDCIVSISTPIGKGAVSIVKLSGEKSLEISSKIFHCKSLQNLEKIQPRYMYFGKLCLEKDVFEECLMVYFKSPFSYTGEDVVEFQIHGGVLLAQKVVELCVKNGARLAEAGEYSKRAFLNGKITLDKAEAVVDEINASSEAELRGSLQMTNGRLSKQIQEEQDTLKTLLAEIEVGMDYPEETEETALKIDVKNVLKKVQNSIENILQTCQSATYLRNGINVALVGKTNVGKSSLMNALLGSDRAIVTDVKGTTRDSITESFLFRGVRINLIDTAGIRETSDVVENIGIEKSKQNLNNADVVLFVMDGSEKESDEDREITKLLKGKNFLTVVNKVDQIRILEKQQNEIEISAKNGTNIEELKQNILVLVLKKNIDFNSVVFANERQLQILKDSLQILEDIEVVPNFALDIVSMLIKKLWATLGKITGNTENEDIIDLIFSKFCLGK